MGDKIKEVKMNTEQLVLHYVSVLMSHKGLFMKITDNKDTYVNNSILSDNIIDYFKQRGEKIERNYRGEYVYLKY